MPTTSSAQDADQLVRPTADRFVVSDELAPHPDPEALFWVVPDNGVAVPVKQRSAVAEALVEASTDGSLTAELHAATQDDPDLIS